MHQLVEDFNDFFINRVNDIHAGLSTPATSIYTTEERQLPCDFNEFQAPLDTSISQSINRLMYPIAGINLNYRKGQGQQTYLALVFNRNKVIKTGCAA